MTYKLLLVDDERFMLSYLKDCISWEKLNVEIIDCALNGADAIEKTRLHKPDLIITDIVMPNMYGLEFIKNIYGQFKNTKIIILSGHQNFDFAKEALLYGVVDYIVKPSLASDIQASVQKAISCIEQERINELKFQTAITDFQRSIPDIKKAFLTLLTVEPSPSVTRQIKEKSEILGFPLENRYYTCVRVLFDSKAPSIKETLSVQELGKLEKHLSALSAGALSLFSIERVGICIGILSNLEPVTDKIILGLNEIIENCLPVRVQVTICISKIFSNIETAYMEFHQIQQTLNSRACSFKSHCFLCNAPMDTNDDFPSVFSCEAYISALRSLTITECEHQIHEWFQNAAAHNLSMYRLRRDLRALLNELDTLLSSLKTGLSPLLHEIDLNEAILQQEESLYRLENMLNRLSEIIISRLTDCESAKYPPMIFLACQFIEEHYCEKISVTTLAEQLFLSPNYLSSLFKKHTGSSISEYITLCRVRKAKELMAASSDMKTYEVADLVGYNDYEYFRKVFKKYVGINPAQYRTEVILPK